MFQSFIKDPDLMLSITLNMIQYINLPGFQTIALYIYGLIFYKWCHGKNAQLQVFFSIISRLLSIVSSQALDI